MAMRYYITLPDPSTLCEGGDLAFRAQGPEGLAQELQDALRRPSLFERWRDAQQDPEDIDPSLGATDAAAQVSGEQDHLQVDLFVTTSLPSAVLRHRLGLLAGGGWQLRDVKAA